MKHFLLFILASFVFRAHAQKPEVIYSFARTEMPLPWYKEQAAAWKKVIDANPKDAKAWYYYYRVNRNLRALDTTDKRSYEEKTQAITKIIDDMEKAIPNTFEYNFCRWSHQGNDYKDYLQYLKKTEELGEGHWEHLDCLVTWGEIERNQQRKDKYALKWYEAQQVSPGLLYYNYNVMAGTKPNAIIFTAGDNDTYPIWILQAQGIRRDITVLNLSLLHIDDYREKVFKELGIEKWDAGYQTAGFEEAFKKEIIKRVAANRKNYPVYVALTLCCQDYIKPIEDNLYLVGLSYQYSDESVDNMAIMKRNFEQQYSLDYLDRTFYHDISADRVYQINANYVVPMLKLYDHYTASGDIQKAGQVKEKLLFIAKGRDEEQEIKKHIMDK